MNELFTQSLRKTASWVIVNKESQEPIFETFVESISKKINTEKYEAIPVLEHLQNLNRRLKSASK